MSNSAISLLELQQRIANTLDEDRYKSIWIRCEITEFNNKKHVYINLTESKDGNLIAKQNATIWSSKKSFILEKFQKGAGTTLQSGLQVLLCVDIKYSALHGLSLNVTDIDPSFTVGQLQVKIQEIKNALTSKGHFERNKSLGLPPYYQNIAVITPSGSAGEGDFKKDADRLENLGLCSFTYYSATMQGLQAEESMSQQLAKVNQDHKNTPFDALVIIRGGGAVADLSWLNNYLSALYICRSYMPVITGLGHERDICVLDEVAKFNAGTPSKCIEFISKSNIDQIYKAQKKVDLLRAAISQKIAIQSNNIENQKQLIRNTFISCVQKFTQVTNYKTSANKQALRSSILSARNSSSRYENSLRQRLSNIIESAFIKAQAEHKLLSKAFESKAGQISTHTTRTKQQMQQTLVTFPSRLLKIYLSAKRSIEMESEMKITKASTSLDEYRKDLSSMYFSKLSQLGIRNLSASISFPSKSILKISHITEHIANFKKELFLFSPMRILNNGYALARNNKGKIITSAEQATQETTIHIDFKDGSISTSPTGESANDSRPSYLD